MERLRLSIEVFAKELAADIAFTNFSPMRNAVIDRFEVYDDQTFLLSSDCLYLCLGNELPPCKHIQEGTSLICADASAACANRECRRCNIIALRGLSAGAIVNKVAAIISQYREYGRIVELSVQGDESLQAAMDVGEKMVGGPLCLLDVNRNVVAASSHQALFGNPLWETVVRDNKPARCEIIDACTQESGPEGALPHNASIRAASVSGYNLLVRNLFRRGRPVGSLWALATKKGEFFPPASLHMLAWIARCLDTWAEKTQQLVAGRGKLTERFLLDLADGTLADDASVDAAAARVGFANKADSEYQLCAFKPISKLTALDADLDLLDSVEKCTPGAISAMTDQGVIALFTLRDCCELPEGPLASLRSLCEGLGYKAVLSTAFFSLTDTAKVLRQVLDCCDIVPSDGQKGQLHMYCNHIPEQVMHFVLASQPPETLLHPMIRKLQRYDEENGVNYLETFKVYLNNRCNAAETSEQLHMHRNTLLHRIKRIEGILGRSFDDWTLRRALLLSIDYLYLEENRPI